jgi:hypothetical protein
LEAAVLGTCRGNRRWAAVFRELWLDSAQREEEGGEAKGLEASARNGGGRSWLAMVARLVLSCSAREAEKERAGVGSTRGRERRRG